MPTEKMNILVTFKNAAKAGVERLNNDLKTVDDTTKKASKSFSLFNAQLLALGSLLATGAFLKGSIQVFADFDDNMRAAGAVTNATSKELMQMTEVAKEMGRTTRFTASNAAEALRFLGMAGFEASEATGALPGVLNLAAAGALDLGSAADIATNVLTAFGLQVDQLSQVNDVLVKTFTSSNVNLIEIGESFKLVGPIAKGVGEDFEDLVGTIGALGNAGIKGTLAGTALKNAIDALLSPSAKEAQLMKELEGRLGGVSLQIQDSEGDFIGFVKIIEQLEKAGLRGDEALKAFGLRAGPAITALLNQGSEALRELTGELREAGGTSEKIADQMEAGIGGQIRKTISVFESLQITIGEAFGPEVTVILTAFRGYLLDIISVIEQWKNDGTLEGLGQTIVDIFSFVNTVVTKSIDILQSFTAATIAAGAAITGNFDLAREALKGWVKETNEIFAQQDNSGIVVKPITDEMNKARKVLEDAAKPSGPIGKGVQKISDTIKDKIVPVASTETQLKAGLIKLNAILEEEAAKLDADYDQGLIKLTQYYDERINILRRSYEQERKILEEKLASEDNVDKKEILNAKLFELDKKYNADVLQLNAERVKEQEKLDEQQIRAKEAIDRKKVAAEKARRDQEARIRQEGQNAFDLELQNQLAKLENQQAKELQTITNYYDAVLEKLRERKASEEEIERISTEKKAEIQEQYRLQQQEREQLAADQALKVQEYRINNLQQLAGDAANVFEQVYKLTGSKSKELFYLAKAAAIAEATMNVAQGVTKAIAQGGILGIAQGALVAAAGAVQIATIASQGLAEGGQVAGTSPHKRADDKLIRATSGEFMMNVDAVKDYGVGFMHAINERRFKFGYGGQIGKQRQNIQGFQNGGLVTPDNKPESSQSENSLNIINVIDPSTLDQYLSTTQGQNAVINVISQRNQEVQRAMKFGA